MIFRKRKILETAQKQLQKGNLEKALKEFQRLVKDDPRDTSARLKIGDIHLRRGQHEDAIAAYAKVAQQFMHDGFDAKAVAIYKQIVRVDPKRVDVYTPLAELYQRLGLLSEAIGAYQTAADIFQREGRRREALELLRKMATVDPSNTTSRLKLAELLSQEELNDEALAEYVAVADELDRQGEREAALGVHTRVLEMDPDRTTSLVAAARASHALRQAEDAERWARRAHEVDAHSAEALEILTEILNSGDREEELDETYRLLAEVYRERGDEERARDILQRHVPARPLDARELQTDPNLSTARQATTSAAPPAPTVRPEPGGAPSADSLAAAWQDDAHAASDPPAGGESEADQVLAEADVYMRFDKHDRAIACLETLLERQPDHVGALERTARALAGKGDVRHARALLGSAVVRARDAGDDTRIEQLSGAIEALERAAAEAAAAAEARAAAEEAERLAAEAPQTPDDAPEIEIDAGAGLDGVVESEPADAVPASEADTEPGLEPSPMAEIDVELDDLFDDEPAAEHEPIAAEAEPIAAELEPKATEPDASLTADPEREAEPFEICVEEEAPAESAAAAEEPAADAALLEEAEFYFQQGLVEEAEPMFRSVLEQAPGHARALQRLAEIEQQRVADAAAAPSGATSSDFAAPASVASPALGDDLADWDEAVPEPTHEGIELDAPAVETGPEQDAAIEFDVELDDVADDAFAGEPAGERTAPLARSPREPVEPERRVAAEPPPAEVHEPVQDAAAPGAIAASGPEDYDLASELTEALEQEDEEPPASTPSGVGPVERDGFQSLFSEFKKGVSRTLGEGDWETHYDLGIAYREMGLLEDAIGEFRQVLGSPTRKVDALHFMGQCALSLERTADATAHLQQALSLPEVSGEQRKVIRYDLGRAFEAQGDVGRARSAYQVVAALDPDFLDVRARLAALPAPGGAGAQSDAEPEEAYESFDDLIAEAQALAEAEDRSTSDGEPGEEREAGSGDEPPRGRRRVTYT